MSTQAVRAVARPLVIVAKPKKAKKARKKRRELVKIEDIHRKPSAKAKITMKHCARALLAEAYNFDEAVALFRMEVILDALRTAKGVKKTAAARLGISTQFILSYVKRGKGLR
jgi:DNA-binding NtrC family response regulator